LRFQLRLRQRRYSSFIFCTTTPPASFAEVLRSQGDVAIALKKPPTGHETVVVSINGKDGLFVPD
jgi:hypothetical protein